MKISASLVALSLGLAGCQSSPAEEVIASPPEVAETVVAETDRTEESTTEDSGSVAETTADESAESDDRDQTADSVQPDPTAEDSLPASAPDVFWAITDETYELVEVDSRTGEILGRYGSWGEPYGDCEGEEGCLFQGLNELAVGPDGALWLADCCEPAVGNLFRIQAGQDFTTESMVGMGSQPVPSPNGELVAHAGLDATVVSDQAGQQLASIGQEDDSDGPLVWFRPLAWIDDETLVVRATGDVVDNLILFDLSDPQTPTRFGPTMGGLISHTDAAVRADGMIFALAKSYRGDDLGEDSDLMGWVFDPSTGDVVAETDLPDDIWDIDYDPTGTFLLTVGDEGVVRFYGAGLSGVLAEGFVAVSW